MAKPRHQMPYNRPTKAYQQNYYKSHNPEANSMAPAQQKKEKKITYAILIILGALLVLSILVGNWITNLIAIVLLVAFTVGFVIRSNKKQNDYIRSLQEQGLRKGDFLRSMEMRGTKETQILAMSKVWDRVAKKQNKQAAK